MHMVYEQVKEQITCTDNVLLKSDRLVVPATLQERIVDRFRRPSGHSKDEAFLPSMDKMVETKVKASAYCVKWLPQFRQQNCTASYMFIQTHI